MKYKYFAYDPRLEDTIIKCPSTQSSEKIY